MARAEIGHYIQVYDQHGNFMYEGIFIDERQGKLFGEIHVRVTKIIKESNPGQVMLHTVKTFPTPRYVPVFIRELTSSEKLLYV